MLAQIGVALQSGPPMAQACRGDAFGRVSPTRLPGRSAAGHAFALAFLGGVIFTVPTLTQHQLHFFTTLTTSPGPRGTSTRIGVPEVSIIAAWLVRASAYRP